MLILRVCCRTFESKTFIDLALSKTLRKRFVKIKPGHIVQARLAVFAIFGSSTNALVVKLAASVKNAAAVSKRARASIET